jgi:hypothetical protein
MEDSVKKAYEILRDSGLTLAEIEQRLAEPEKPARYIARWPGDTGYVVEDEEAFFAQVVAIDGACHHRHPNGGGLVANSASVDPGSFVGVNAQVSEGVRK